MFFKTHRNAIKATAAKVKQPALRLNNTTNWLLLVSQLINFSLIMEQLTVWMLALIALCLLWQSAILAGLFKRPMSGVLFVIAVLGCIALAISSQALGLLLTMLHLLAFAYVLKTLELKQRGDLYQLILIGLFLNASAMIFNQSLAFASLLVIAILVNITVLFSFFLHHENKLYDDSFSYYSFPLKGAAKLFLQSIPLTIILFIIFPRLAPFWQVPLAKSAKTGLSEQIAPGDIAQLIKSSDLVFRVNFSTNAPSFNQLYWRTLVLENYNGKQWSKQSNRSIEEIIANLELKPINYQTAQSKSTKYQVIAEPSYQHWLYALPVAQVSQEQIIMLPDYTLLNKQPVTQTMSYNLVSYLQMPMDFTLSERTKRRNLALPEGVNPQLRAEAKILISQGYSNEALIQQVLNNIRQNNFHYTLKPPPLRSNSLDQFYFETKAGFCVHYASSFTFLMRAAGIPARVVTGYMGGEYNRNGNYYSIYQYDAHAWSEVWLEDKGWVRVDPTAAVSPERVEQGFSSALFEEQAALNTNIFSLQNYRHIAVINFFRQQLDALDYQWTRWVIGYNNKRQLDLLNRWFGHFSLWKLASIMALALISVLLWLWLTSRSKKIKVNYPPWQKNYLAALSLLAAKGIEKTPQQSFEQFAEQVVNSFPQLGISFKKLSQCYQKLHYQALSAEEKQQLLGKQQQYFRQFKQQLKITKK